MARKIIDPAHAGSRPRFDVTGAVLSALGLLFVVLGLLISRTYGFFGARKDFSIGGTVIIPKGWISPVWISVAIGALFLLVSLVLICSGGKKGQGVLNVMRTFPERVEKLGMGTQLIQSVIIQG